MLVAEFRLLRHSRPHRWSRDEPQPSSPTPCACEPRHPVSLLDVAFQHGEKFGQLPPAFRRAVRVLDAMVDVRVNQLFRQRFQAATGRNDLREDLRAVPVLLQHPLDCAELAGDLANPDNGSAALFLRMLVTFIGHAARITGIAASVKNGL